MKGVGWSKISQNLHKQQGMWTNKLKCRRMVNKKELIKEQQHTKLKQEWPYTVHYAATIKPCNIHCQCQALCSFQSRWFSHNSRQQAEHCGQQDHGVRSSFPRDMPYQSLLDASATVPSASRSCAAKQTQSGRACSILKRCGIRLISNTKLITEVF